jgi:hypothetical protein
VEEVVHFIAVIMEETMVDQGLQPQVEVTELNVVQQMLVLPAGLVEMEDQHTMVAGVVDFWEQVLQVHMETLVVHTLEPEVARVVDMAAEEDIIQVVAEELVAEVDIVAVQEEPQMVVPAVAVALLTMERIRPTQLVQEVEME